MNRSSYYHHHKLVLFFLNKLYGLVPSVTHYSTNGSNHMNVKSVLTAQPVTQVSVPCG